MLLRCPRALKLLSGGASQLWRKSKATPTEHGMNSAKQLNGTLLKSNIPQWFANRRTAKFTINT